MFFAYTSLSLTVWEPLYFYSKPEGLQKSVPKNIENRWDRHVIFIQSVPSGTYRQKYRLGPVATLGINSVFVFQAHPASTPPNGDSLSSYLIH